MAREVRVGMGVVDRLVLLVAWIATCGLVYLLGFYVGKGTQERQLGLEDRVVRLPVTSPLPAEGRRQQASKNDFVFYDKLMGEHGAERAAEPTRPAAAPAASVAVAKPPPAPAPTPAVAKLPSAPAPTAAVVKALPPAPAPVTAVAKPAPAPPAPTVAVAKPAPPAPARQPPLPADIPEKAAPPAEPAPVTAAARPPGTGWTVLANPTRSREEADGLLRQLRGRGYDASVVRVLRDGDTWYRVQVGRFATSEQASELMHRLREREGVSHVFVASE